MTPHHKTLSEVEISSPRLAEVRRAIALWYSNHARRLPWRRPGLSAWAILVSEIMLQQTPVVRVIPRWEEWMQRWPTPRDLAAASHAEVLRAWDRLGYPRRALRLHEAACTISHEHNNYVPDTAEALRALPGIGAYTAAAVAAFAYGQREAVVDVNIRRVLNRVFRGQEPVGSGVSTRDMHVAEDVLPHEDHVEWNAAVMELGAVVCTARNPSCEQCPVAEHCLWLARGRPQAPEKKKTTQAWEGTDRQLRGAIMALLRENTSGIARDTLCPTSTVAEVLPLEPAPSLQRVHVLAAGDFSRLERILADLIHDGLVECTADVVHLPGD